MSSKEEIMQWYKNCDHNIVISQDNKSEEYVGVAICKDTLDTYKASGKEITDVLNDLRCMIGGIYHR